MARMFMLRNSAKAWGFVAMGLHWLLAVLIVGQFVLGAVAADMSVSPFKLDLFVWHKSFGVTILLLVMLRLGWRLTNRAPGLPTSVPTHERQLARINHGLLYGLMIAVPLSGWIVSDTSRIPFRIFWSIPTPDLLPVNREVSELAAGVHETLVVLMIVLVAVHVLAAFRHHFVKHNDVLLRMLPRRESFGDRP